MLRRLSELSARERVLLAAGALWVLLARTALLSRSGSFRALQAGLERIAARLPSLHGYSIEQAVWAVTAAARRVPGTRCLAFALALRGLLAQTGVAAELRIGVAKTDARTLTAHAWVQCGERALSWGEPVDGYHVLDATLSSRRP